MNFYPGIRGRMGQWDYFVVKMSMREFAESVKFAHDVYEDRTLDDAIQRALNEPRVRNQIVTYLQRHEDRFFSSMVIAAFGGHPRWFPVQVSEEEGFEILVGDPRLDDTFGVLRFDGTQDYYALDGQHRLAAIKALVGPEDPAAADAPPGFKDEEVSVIVVAPQEGEDQKQFMQRYRRLFGHLNRYAKATDKLTNIIMDEDDSFAISTRRLVMDHEFFHATGPHYESPRIKTEKSKSLKRSDTYFTSLETLYGINIKLLNGRGRRNKTQGWCGGNEGQDIKEFMLLRPSEECLDELYRELELYWDGILEALPVLREEPSKMRDHDADPGSVLDSEAEETTDHLLFWPIGQEMLASIVREVFDLRLPDAKDPTRNAVKGALAGLKDLEWRLHRPPWRYFLLVQDERGWKLRSEDRKEAIKIGQQIQQWVLGLDEHDDDGLAELKERWALRLQPAQSEDEVEQMWADVLKQRANLADASSS